MLTLQFNFTILESQVLEYLAAYVALPHDSVKGEEKK